MYKFLDGVVNLTPLIELLIFAVHELHIEEQELLNMEFRYLMWIRQAYDNRVQKEDARFANLLCLIYNINRGKNRPAKEPKDFMPKRPLTAKEQEEEILKAFGPYLENSD